MTDTITLPRSVVEQALEALNPTASGNWTSTIALNAEAAIHALRAALEQPNHIAQHLNMVPEGWRPVPVEPTDSQIRAAQDTWWHACNSEMYWDQIYAAMLAAAPQPPVVEQTQGEQEPVAWQSIEAMAVQRYKVVPAHDSMFYRHAVVAGDGTQQLYIGRETECENIARKFAGAFLDGAYVALLYTHPQNLNCKSTQARLATLWGYEKPQPPRQPLTDEQIGEIEGWFSNEFGLEAKHSIDFARSIERAHDITGETK